MAEKADVPDDGVHIDEYAIEWPHTRWNWVLTNVPHPVYDSIEMAPGEPISVKGRPGPAKVSWGVLFLLPSIIT